MIHALFVFGTRPEAIKLAPVIHQFQRLPDRFRVSVCFTSQHKELLRQVTEFFTVTEDVDLDVMIENQTLEHVTSEVLLRMRNVLHDFKPDIILVQGDTTTVFAAALAAFYQKVKVGHVEAGLRSHVRYSPFPEEINRRLASVLADFHFAPTTRAAANLKAEGIPSRQIFVTGNTVVDALQLGLSLLNQWPQERRRALWKEAGLAEEFVDRVFRDETRLITVTAHRRESFGAPFAEMCRAMRDIVDEADDVEIVYPVHPNPNVRATVEDILRGHARIHLIEPVRYEQLIDFMSRSVLLLTDSGGIQEEAPSLKKPVLVMREVTERPEGVEAGVAKLVGTDREVIVSTVRNLLDDRDAYARMTGAENPYGDGRASERIADIITKGFSGEE